MPGANCCMVGCPAVQSRHRGLSFHSLPKLRVDASWRSQLINTINRCDKSFNPEHATICSRHFTEECFHTHPSGKKFLVKGSLPTLHVLQPHNTTVQQSRKKLNLFEERHPPAIPDRVIYRNLQDVLTDAKVVSGDWKLVADESPDQVVLGIVRNQQLVMSASVGRDLTATIWVMGIPMKDTVNIESKKLENFLSELSTKNVCIGVTDQQLQNIVPNNQTANGSFIKNCTHTWVADENGSFVKNSTHTLEADGNGSFVKNSTHTWVADRNRSVIKNSKHRLVADGKLELVSSLFSNQCCRLITGNATVCLSCKALKYKLMRIRRRKTETEAREIKPKTPLRWATNASLKKALFNIRREAKRLKLEVERLKKRIANEAVPVSDSIYSAYSSLK